MSDKVYYYPPMPRILEANSYKGVLYWIVSRGSWPTAYIEAEKSDAVNDVVHGGLTYSGKNMYAECDGYCIGWDYAHHGDYMYFGPNGDIPGHVWSIDEIRADVHAAIDAALKEEIGVESTKTEK